MEPNQLESKIDYFSDYEQKVMDQWIRDYIHCEVTWSDFFEFYYKDFQISSNDNDEAILRLIQSLINNLGSDYNNNNQLSQQLLNIEKYRCILFLKFNFNLDSLLELIKPFVDPEMDHFVEDWGKHRNICLVLLIVLRYLQENAHHASVHHSTSEQIYDYLLRILTKCDHLEAKHFAIISSVSLCSLSGLSVHSNDDELKGIMNSLALTQNGDLNQVNLLHNSGDECMRYQVAFQARQYLDQLTETGHKSTLKPSVELSTDRFCARNNAFSSTETVSSMYAVKSGVYFYEAIILTDGEIRIGWTTLENNNNNGHSSILGNDFYSVGFDGFSQLVWHCRSSHRITQTNETIHNSKCWKASDVIGCLIDLEKKRFAFYLNGKEIVISHKIINFSTSPYFASASLAAQQQCYFNFGQAPFRYKPEGVQFKDFCKVSNENAFKYKLKETALILEVKPTAEKVNNKLTEKILPGNIIDDSDKGQVQGWFDDQIVMMESCVVKNRFHKSGKSLQKNFTKLALNGRSYRLFESMIKLIGNGSQRKNDKIIRFKPNIENHKIDVLLQWIVHCLTPMISELTQKRNQLSPLARVQISRIKNEYPMEYMCKKYMNERTSDLPELQKRNFFIVLATLITQNNFWLISMGKFVNELVHFLVSTLSESAYRTNELSDSSLLFLIIAIENVTINSNMTEEMGKMLKLTQTLQMLANKCDQTNSHYYIDIYERASTRPTELQISLCAKHFLNYLTNHQHLHTSETVDFVQTKSILNQADSTLNMKFSTDCFTVRNDYYDSKYWQSVRSVCAAEKDIYYYEVILHTSGPMRIGWATARTDLTNQFAIGEDELSIGFDGFLQCITNDRVKCPIESSIKSKWQPGEVIGCLIDHEKRSFQFYINGKQVTKSKSVSKSKTKVYFSTHPYHAAISLYLHQQCTINFGQTPFKYPPKRVDFKDFYKQTNSSSKMTVGYRLNNDTILCPLCNEQKATLKFCNCNHWTFCWKCASKLIECPNCDNC